MFYRILFSVLFFIIINSCEENSLSNEIVPPAAEPIVEIETPKTGKIVSEIVYIKAKTRDKDGIKGIDFFIDDSLFFSDLERPYRYGWNTIKYQENTEHTVKLLLYTSLNDTIESEPITLIVQNSNAIPKKVNIISVSYDTTQVIDNLVEMFISWNSSKDNDFFSYTLLHSETEEGVKDSIYFSVNNFDTSFSTTRYKPNIEHWYWIMVKDTVGLKSIGDGKPNLTKTTPPDTSILNPIVYEDGFQISWTKCTDNDFQSYRLLQSNYENMIESVLINEFQDSLETSYVIDQKSLRYYQVETVNIWGLTSRSNIEASDYSVLIGNGEYSVLNTVTLSDNNLSNINTIPAGLFELINLEWIDLSSFELNDVLAPEIGNLQKLKYLNLSYNQLSGEVPSEIQNLIKLEYLNLSHNQFSGEPTTIIQNIQTLEYLNLSFNNFTGTISSKLYNINNLKRLFLNNNQFFDTLGSAIENLTNASEVELQHNLLYGILPDEICILYNNDININLRNNLFCHPYPNCEINFEYFISNQDTSNCE